MKQLTKYSKIIACMVLLLILCFVTTMHITLTFLGDTKSSSATITIGASIYFDGTNGVEVATSDGLTIVPSQTVDVKTTLRVVNSAGGATSGVLKVIPSLIAGSTGANLTLTAGNTYDVYINGTKSTDSVVVVYNSGLYLADKANTANLKVFTPTTSGTTIKFTVPVTFPSTLGNSAGGKKCTITMKGVIIQSPVYDDMGTTVDTTIVDYQPYFYELDPKPYRLVEENGKQYIYFGEFPQTIKASSVTITSTPVDSNGYYTGSDGAKYAKVTANMSGTGTQYNTSDGTTMTTGTDYYFKVEPLKWRVLSNNGTTALIVCDNIITAIAYQSHYIQSGSIYYATDSSGNIITDNGIQVYANNYKWSALRTFLTGDFYNKAFTTSEQAIIQTTIVDNSVASTGDSSNPYVCENTNDKIFALSKAEAMNTAYGFTNSESPNTNRTWKGSDYAKANYLWVDSSSANSSFWLRSPYSLYSYRAWHDDLAGFINHHFAYYADTGVVPALQLSL